MPAHKKLKNLISKYFDANEFQELCFNLAIKYDNIPGNTLEVKISELINHCYRYKRMEELIHECREVRPMVDWPKPDEVNIALGNAPNDSFSQATTEIHGDYVKGVKVGGDIIMSPKIELIIKELQTDNAQELMNRISIIFSSNPEMNELARNAISQTIVDFLEKASLADRKSVLMFLYKSGFINGDVPKILLQDANLTKINLSGESFESANLAGANLSESELSGTHFVHSNLSKANLQGANMVDTVLEYTNLQNGILDGNDLRWVTLNNVDLQYASLVYTNLEGNNLSSVKLVSADLSNSNLSNTTWNLFEERKIHDMGQTYYFEVNQHVYCNAQEAKFQNSQLIDADMSGANFRKADFTNANLQGAMLDSIVGSINGEKGFNETLVIEKISRLYFDIKMKPESDHAHMTNLSYANLNGANLQNTSLDKTDLRYANLRNANLINSRHGRANLLKADLLNAKLKSYENWRVGKTTAYMRLPNGKILRPGMMEFLLTHEAFFLSFFIGAIVPIFIQDTFSSLLNNLLTLSLRLILGYIITSLFFWVSKRIFPNQWFVIVGALIGFFLYGGFLYLLITMIGGFYIAQLVPYLKGGGFLEQIAVIYDVRQNQTITILNDIAQIFDSFQFQWLIATLLFVVGIYFLMPAFSIAAIMTYKTERDVYWQFLNIVFPIIVFFVKRAFINLTQGVLLGLVANLLFNLDILLGVALGILWFTYQFVLYLWTWRDDLEHHFKL